MQATARDEEADALAIANRVPSSRDGWVLQVGDVVEHYVTGTRLQIIEIDFWGGAHDVGGHTLVVEPIDAATPTLITYDGDEWEMDYMDDECVYACDSAERSSFCEMCDIHFRAYFVEWTWANGRRWFELAPRSLHLRKVHSSCERCKVVKPRARILWQWAWRVIKARAIADFWFELIHRPGHVQAHAHAMQRDMGWEAGA